MPDEPKPGTLPLTGGWAPRQNVSPGATANPMNDPAASGPVPDCWASKKPQTPGASDEQSTGRHAERAASFGALLSAFIASSWCWLPPLLILGGISGAGITAYLENYRPIFMAVTFGLLGVAFYLTYRPRRSSPDRSASGAPAAKIMAFNKVMLWAVTAIAIAFLFFPQTITNLWATNDVVTADMERTVIRIEGMT